MPPLVRRLSAFLAIALLGLLAAACGANPTATPSPTPPQSTPTPTAQVDLHPTIGEPFELRIGNVAFLDANGYRVEFVRVVSDTRCPVDVTCVTAGRAVIELSVRQTAGGAPSTALLGIGDAGPEPQKTTHGAFTIEFVEIGPERHSDNRPLDYVVTLTAAHAAEATPTPTPQIDLHPTIGQPFELRPGNVAFLDANGYRIEFVRVVSDSRCPVDVTCVTAGRAVIELSVRQYVSGPETSAMLAIGDSGPEPTKMTVGPFEIVFVELAPQPHTEQPDPEYVATLQVNNAPGGA